ncbi:FAD-binding oxidoreductase [Nonomuraea sp. NPDC047897]|uniref:FAD-binding oxidoreductase n=1 Tax=Nonomuraea sp. NPDC047897 TaxID=3364346 RepID=UPI0037211F1F
MNPTTTPATTPTTAPTPTTTPATAPTPASTSATTSATTFATTSATARSAADRAVGSGARTTGHAVGRGLRDVFDGTVHLPGDDGYDTARLAWNRAIDPRPVAVAEAEHARDVRAAVAAAREHGLSLTVQSTGHGTHLPADGGLLLRTGRLAGVRVDPERRTARVGAGVLWSDVLAACAPYGLASVSGTPAIGVAGYTLGGGTGWLSRLYGYAADNLLSARLVTAGGETVTASADEHPDLFWALRGGGGNFGVVTELEFRLYPVAEVYAGMSVHPVERAADTLARYREWALTEPDELNTSVILLRAPDPAGGPGGWALGVRAFYAGGADSARRHLEPLLEAAGPAVTGGFGAMTFAEAVPAFGGPPPAPMVVEQHLDLLRQVPDDVIEAVMTAVEASGPGEGSRLMAIELRHWGGAMARPAPDAGPVGHRDVPFSMIATAVPTDTPSGRDRAAGAGVREVAAALRPHATGGSFLNFLTNPARTRDAYTLADHARLSRVKQVWDPENVFGRVHNIPPV